MTGLRKLTQSFSHENVGKAPRLVLVVTPHDCTRLIEVLSAMDLEIHRVESCREARYVLQQGRVPELIVTGVSLGDDNWCGLLRLTVKLDIRAPVILSCSSADERLWSEALWRGVYDVLVEPYEDDQVRWIVGGALRAQPYLQAKQFVGVPAG